MANLTIGHLSKSDESKLSAIPVKEGQVIYSEKNGVQFVDYASTRHTLGSVLYGIYNGTTFLDFSTATKTDILTALGASSVPDGQLINIGKSICNYRIIGSTSMLAKNNKDSIELDASSYGYVINIPNLTDTDIVTIDLLVSINNTSNGNKTFLLSISNDGTITAASSMDVDGDFDSSTCDVLVNKSGTMYLIGAKVKSVIKIASYSVSINGTVSNDAEGFYAIIP